LFLTQPAQSVLFFLANTGALSAPATSISAWSLDWGLLVCLAVYLYGKLHPRMWPSAAEGLALSPDIVFAAILSRNHLWSH